MPDPIRSLRISDADWSALERIAAARGDLHGGTPSRGKTLVRLIRDAAAKLTPPADEPPHATEGDGTR